MVDIAQRLEEWAASPLTTKAHIRGVKAVMRIAAERIRELEQEAARLDWLMRQVCCDEIGLSLPLVHDSDTHYRNFRAAIDAARKEKGHG